MAGWAGLGAGAKAAVVAAGVAVTGGAVVLVSQAARDPAPLAASAPDPGVEPSGQVESAAAADPAPAPAPSPAVEAAEPSPEAATEAPPAAEPEPPPAADTAAAEPPPAAEPTPAAEPPEPDAATVPAFDLVRVEPDGAAVVAGTAAPGAKVAVLVDAGAVAEVEANARGEFVAMFTLAPSAAPRLMTLVAEAAGARLVSPEPVLLAPVAAPEPPAAAETAAEPAPAVEPPAEPAAAPEAILLGQEGAEPLTPPADPAAARPVSITAISYTETGEVRLAGTATSGALVRLYLDTGLVAEMPVGAFGGWGGVLPEIAPGVYTLRADEVGADGTVVSRFSTPFKRESLETLAAVMGLTPPTAAPQAASGAEPAAPAAVPAAGTTAAPESPAPSAAAVAAPEVPLAATPDPVTAPVAPATAEPPPAAASQPEPAPEPAPEPPPEPPPEPEPADLPTVAEAPEVAAAAPADPPTPPAPALAPDAPVPEIAALPAADPPPAAATTVEPVVPAPEPAAAEPAAPAAATQPPAPPPPVTVTVQPGFTLWGIAEGQWGDGFLYVQVFAQNRDQIEDPDLIYPGQVFTMPAVE